jgi:hypothetical protein
MSAILGHFIQYDATNLRRMVAHFAAWDGFQGLWRYSRHVDDPDRKASNVPSNMLLLESHQLRATNATSPVLFL